MNNLLTLEPGMIIWTFLTFGLLLFILKRFGWKPLLTALEKREERIHNDLQRAEHAREESERLLAEHKKLIAASEQEARKIIDEARGTAEKLRDDIIAKANEQATHISQQATLAIKRERDSAIVQLRNEVADLAIAAAEKILQESLNDEKHRKIVGAFIDDLPKN